MYVCIYARVFAARGFLALRFFVAETPRSSAILFLRDSVYIVVVPREIEFLIPWAHDAEAKVYERGIIYTVGDNRAARARFYEEIF